MTKYLVSSAGTYNAARSHRPIACQSTPWRRDRPRDQVLLAEQAGLLLPRLRGATVTKAQTPIGCMTSIFCIALLATRRSIGAGDKKKYVR
jgi:hypothetical protein